ncbi:hypothetical protein B0H15DRAFT_862154 [Mycena belliarum]|uniref:Uncharacterized protein n=1 Tax=Mycena belliarum TaxID=1033014 RepID=A0AAD6TTQ1_9AGAR|nr:hypothetical protein B0H15DRAFT_862154 [Mycena belliae]
MASPTIPTIAPDTAFLTGTIFSTSDSSNTFGSTRSTTSEASGGAATAAVTAFGSPTPSPPNAGPDNRISAGAVAGISLGLGLFVGLIGAMLLYLWRRRRAPKNGDGEALLGYQRDAGYQRDEKFASPEPIPPPSPTVPTPYNRILEWAQGTRPSSVSSMPSSFATRDVPDSDEATVVRSQSNASSRSAYSQASAAYSQVSTARPGRPSDENHPEFYDSGRPPHLYRISEHE